MTVRILVGDCRERLRELPDASVQCCVTSPPYFGLRDYGVAGQIGLEQTPDDYVAEMVAVFREVRRVLRDDGTLWLNLGDSYAGSWGAQSREHAGKHAPNVSALSANQVKAAAIRASGTGSLSRPPGLKPKDLMMIPSRVALALQADGWYLRSEIIWHKPNPMPESVSDRPTSAHEKVFLLAKSERYFYDADAIREPHATPEDQRSSKHGRQALRGQEAIRPRGNLEAVDDPAARYYADGGRNARNVWTIATQPCSEAHFATMAPRLAELSIKAGTGPGDTVLDPFGGAGTTGLMADRLGRNAVLIELNPEYAVMAERRIHGDAGMFAALEVA